MMHVLKKLWAHLLQHIYVLYTGSYKSANSALCNLINELRKSYILWPLRNEFNRFDNTGERMLDFVYHQHYKNCDIEVFALQW